MALGDGISFLTASAGTGTFVFASARASFLTPTQAVTLGELTDGQLVSYLAVDSLTNPIQRAWGHGTFHSAGGGSVTRDAAEKWVNNTTAGTGSPLPFSAPPFVSLTVLAPDIIQGVVNDTNVTGALSPGTLTLGWTGTLLSTRMPALFGDVTSSAGTTTTALANIPNDVPMAGDILATNIASPSTPAAGKTRIYVDSTQKILSVKNDAGAVTITISPATAGANQFATGIGGGGGITFAQPSFSNISGTLGAGQFGPLTGDVTTSGYVATIAANAVTNAKLAQAAAWTLKGNATGALANVTDFTIDSLTAKATPTTADEVLLWDAAASAMKKASIAGLVGAGVSSFNSRTGAVVPAAGDYTQALVTPAYAMSVFTSSGTFTTPANSTTSTVYRFRMVGGGGGGGGVGNNGVGVPTSFAGAGGGGGEYAEGTFTGVAANTAITITVGAAGTAGNSSGGNGGGGGTTSIGSPVSVTAGGGGGGGGATGTTAAFGGSPGAGGTGSALFRVSGQGGGEGENLSSANNGSYGPAGGSSMLGVAGYGIAVGFGAIGTSGTGFGAGGGGAITLNTAGGAGTAGIVIIERIQG